VRDPAPTQTWLQIQTSIHETLDQPLVGLRNMTPRAWLKADKGCVAINHTACWLPSLRLLEEVAIFAAKNRQSSCVLDLRDLLFSQGDTAGTYLSRFSNRLKPFLHRGFTSVSMADSRHYEGGMHYAVAKLLEEAGLPINPSLCHRAINAGANSDPHEGKVGYHAQTTMVFLE